MKQRFEVYTQLSFAAAHHLRGYSGECSNPHGHTYEVKVHILCDELNEIGIALDFKEIKLAIKVILKELDHRDLNDLPQFKHDNPSTENIAKYIYHQLSSKLATDKIQISKIGVFENHDSGVFYWEE